MFKKFFATVLTAVILAAGFSLSAHAQASAPVQYQHVRNATAKITYGGKTFLVDPMLAPKHAYPGFSSTVNEQQRFPLIDMAETPAKVIQGIDAVIITHTHLDHWDVEAQQLLPKYLPVFVQNAGDARIIRMQGFKNVHVIGQNTPFDSITISKTSGQHGTDEMFAIPDIAESLGDSMGFVLQGKDLPTVYFAGDTTWHDYVDDALQAYSPDIIVLNTGFAQITMGSGGSAFGGSLIMGAEDVLRAYEAMPLAQIIAVHMDAVNHTTVTGEQMRSFVKQHKLNDRVAVPREGETLKF